MSVATMWLIKIAVLLPSAPVRFLSFAFIALLCLGIHRTLLFAFIAPTFERGETDLEFRPAVFQMRGQQ